MPLAFSYGAETMATNVVVVRSLWRRAQWSKCAAVDNAVVQYLLTKVAKVRKRSKLGGRVETLVVADAVVNVFSCG